MKSNVTPHHEQFILAINLVGGILEMSKILNVTQQAIYRWLKKTAPVPDVKYCLLIEKYTNGEITREDLRPDIFNKKEILNEPNVSLKKGMALIKKAFSDLSNGGK